MNPHSLYQGNRGRMSDGKVINFYVANQLVRQMDDDCAAIVNRGKLIAPCEEGLRDIKVAEAVYRSASTQSVVSI